MNSKIKTMLLPAILLSHAAVATAAIDLQGIVLSDSGKPLVNAVVQIDDQQTLTDSEGRYKLSVTEKDIYQLVFLTDAHYPMIHSYSRYELTGRSNSASFSLSPVKLVEKKPGRTMLAFTGDTMMDRRYKKPHAGEPVLMHAGNEEQDTKNLLRHIRPYLLLADYTSTNLETIIAKKEPADTASKSVLISSPPETLDALSWAGVDYVTLGNNHTYDYLDKGIKLTLKYLDKSTLEYSGAGLNEAQALAPLRAEIAGQDFSFLGYVGWPGTSKPSQSAEKDKGGPPLGTVENIRRSVLAEAAENRTTIVQLHGGEEYSEEPTNMTINRLKSAITAGADLAIGHHPHVTQGYELYKDKLIAWSLGNFLFDQYIYSTQLTAVLYVWMDGENFHRAELVPVYIKGYIPTPATGSARQYVLKRLAYLSKERGLTFSASGGHAVIDPRQQTSQQTSISRKVTANPGIMDLRNMPWWVSPTSSRADASGPFSYRLGSERLVRGDFENFALFGIADRSWLLPNSRSSISNEKANSGNLSMKINLESGESGYVGMRKFARAFSRATPATVSGSLHSRQPVKISAFLQGRPSKMGVSTALKKGPMQLLGTVSLPGSEQWQDFAFDYNSPRSARSFKSVRILLEISVPDSGGQVGEGQTVYLDDIAVIEWLTPFLESGEGSGLGAPNRATHIELDFNDREKIPVTLQLQDIL